MKRMNWAIIGIMIEYFPLIFPIFFFGLIWINQVDQDEISLGTVVIIDLHHTVERVHLHQAPMTAPSLGPSYSIIRFPEQWSVAVIYENQTINVDVASNDWYHLKRGMTVELIKIQGKLFKSGYRIHLIDNK